MYTCDPFPFLYVTTSNIKITLKSCSDFKVSPCFHCSLYIIPWLPLFENRVKEWSVWSNVYIGNFYHLVLVMRAVFMIGGSQGIPMGMEQGIRDVFSYLCLEQDYLSITKEKLENVENVAMCLCWSLVIKQMYQKSVYTWIQF